MQKILFTLILFVSAILACGQSGIDSVLNSILVNNKTIATHTQLMEAKQLQYQTGLTPYDPTAEYDYLFGTPANMGNQTDIIVSQSFDFPTAYSKKGQVADGQEEQLEYEVSIQRQDILLDAKLLCIELIYLNKQIAQMETRLVNAQQVNDDLNSKLESEEVGAIDANKAKLVLLHAKTGLQLLEGEREALLLQLTEMNGGQPIDPIDTTYPILADLPRVDSLEQVIEANDPVLKLYEQQVAVSDMQVGLSKAMALPKIETGYHYQAILGQTFNGVHFGISIPLWENKNTVKQSKAYSLYSELELEQHRTDHLYEIRELYTRYETLVLGIAEYEAVLNSLSSEELLKQSLELEQISFIEYALEMEYYYSAIDQYLQLEKELHLTIAKLLKHEL